MKTEKISLQELKVWLDEKKDLLLVDVLPPEYFSEKHIKGAVNAPVYEVAFMDYINKFSDDKQKTIVVYNENQDSLAATDAATKLVMAGFENVYEFSGGLSQWENADYPLERGESLAVPALADGKYEIDKEKSIIGWIGRNAKYAHHGKITIKSGRLVIENERVLGGEIVLDMTTITADDLSDNMGKGILESHLKSLDFFDVKKFPEASFEFESVEKIQFSRIGTPNVAVSGSMTIKDITNPISFLAMIVPMADGIVNGQAHFDFDRTIWNVRYGSEKFFEKLGMHLVNDAISLELFLTAKL